MSDKKWLLGDMKISEAKSYKYLGVVINRRLTDSDHIRHHLGKKVKKWKDTLDIY